MSKIIILGPPLSGKTTLGKYLKQTQSSTVMDFDEELLRLNGGVWPGGEPGLNDRLMRQVIAAVLARDEIIFTAFYFGVDKLKQARTKGFKIVQLEVGSEDVKARNQERLKVQPDNDAFKYYEQNVEYQDKIRKLGLVDLVVKADKATSDIAKEILAL